MIVNLIINKKNITVAIIAIIDIAAIVDIVDIVAIVSIVSIITIIDIVFIVIVGAIVEISVAISIKHFQRKRNTFFLFLIEIKS